MIFEFEILHDTKRCRCEQHRNVHVCCFDNGINVHKINGVARIVLGIVCIVSFEFTASARLREQWEGASVEIGHVSILDSAFAV